ncbi:hypothetical protein NHX12_001337 [Muraenolepis orangiensis]|uniref:Ig-like domain-containing protein n=1 Tax=Muraenolepis orangiensis TaxID=630683 RepID=A0A9Q0IH45_9TELE|nr:hypothetical protein NHX12_001337 [Muraenolepis orangiensis]
MRTYVTLLGLLLVLQAGLLPSPALGCYQCLVDMRASMKLCWGHVITRYNIRNMDSCFKKIDRLFNYNEKVIVAGRVGEGYDVQLKKLLDDQILPMVEEFDNKLHDDTVYEERLQRAADSFIAAASKLPRVSGCFPPCGFQAAGAVYNCITCQYDSCDFPLDCPLKTLNVNEFSGTQMWCNVPFPLPANIELIWRYAEEVKTQKVDQFKEVSVGVDTLYSIPSARRWHQGTYQCELYAGQRSIARLYFYLTGGRITGASPVPDGSPHVLQRILRLLPPPAVLTTCLTAVLLLVFLSLGVLYWCLVPRRIRDGDQACARSQDIRELHVVQ